MVGGIFDSKAGNGTLNREREKNEMKKEYAKPVVEEMSIKETAAGGSKPAVHDGYIYEMKVGDRTVAVEEYYPASGEEE